MSRMLSREFFEWEIGTAVSSEAMGSANAKGLLDHDAAQREKIERMKGLLERAASVPGLGSNLRWKIQAELSRED